MLTFKHLFPFFFSDGKWEISVFSVCFGRSRFDSPHYNLSVVILAAFQTTPLIPFEDVYLSNMCSEKAGIKLLFSSRSFRFVFALREIFSLISKNYFNFNLSKIVSSKRNRKYYAIYGGLLHGYTLFFTKPHKISTIIINYAHECIETYSNGVNTTVGHNEPAHFNLKMFPDTGLRFRNLTCLEQEEYTWNEDLLD